MRLAWGIVALLMILWLLGIDHHAPRSLIPLLLVVAIIVLLADLLSGRRTTV
jgi:hypothetical protein